MDTPPVRSTHVLPPPSPLESCELLFRGHPLHRREILAHAAGELELRPVLPGDATAIDRLVRQSSERSRYRRFHGALDRLTPRQLAGIVDVDHHRRETLVVLRGGRLIGFGQYVPEDEHTVEIALLVADRWQGQGIGKLLAGRLLRAAREEGFATLTATVLSDNRPGVALVMGLGEDVAIRRDGPTVEVRVPLADLPPVAVAAPTPLVPPSRRRPTAA